MRSRCPNGARCLVENRSRCRRFASAEPCDPRGHARNFMPASPTDQASEAHHMSVIETGGIDCDLHPAVPNLKALHPYLSDHWRDIVIQRGVGELESIAYPANSPLTARPDWRVDGKKPGSDLDLLRRHALDPFRTSI